MMYVKGQEYKHCNVMCFKGDNFVLIESSKRGIDHEIVKSDSITQIIRNMQRIKSLVAIICVEIDKPALFKWKPLLIRSCNEISRLSASVEIGFTITPIHLYKKLLKYDGKRNYKILTTWSRQNGFIR